jgi:uncharacterized protein (UPF0147 family)
MNTITNHGSAVFVLGLFFCPGVMQAQTPAPLIPPQGQFPGRPGFGMPMMSGGCCAMRMGMQQMAKPATGLQALQQAFTLLYTVDRQLVKNQIKGSAAQALRQDVKAMKQAARAKNATLDQRKEMTLQTLQTSITDLQVLVKDPKLPAQARMPLTVAAQQLQQLYLLAQQ